MPGDERGITDPFEGYDMKELVALSEPEWRAYIVHMNMKAAYDRRQTQKEIHLIRKLIDEQPEQRRATWAMVISIICCATAVASAIISLWVG